MSRTLKMWCLALLALLAACGGGESSSTSSTATPDPAPVSTEATTEQVAAAKQALHSAALGVLVGATVEVRDAFDKTAKVLYTTTTDTNGQFSITLPDYANYAMFLVTVSGGNDWDVNDTGKRDATPTAFKGAIHALVDPKDLIVGTINVSLLSDAAYRLLGGDLARFDVSSLNAELNRIARLLLKTSLIGAENIGSSELLHFDATNQTHRAALAFDFAALSQPVDQGADASSILDKYHAGSDDVAKAWSTLTTPIPGVVQTLAQELNASSVKLQVGVAGTGRILGTALPGGQLDRTPAPYATVLPRDDSTISFEAVETDANWKFDSWVGCSAVVGKRCDVVASKDMVISARFAMAPVVKQGVTSLGRVTPQDSVTGVRFNADGSATIVTRDSATIAFLKTVTTGSLVQTGHVEHPMVKVSSIVAGPSEVGSAAVPMTLLTFRYEEASPVDAYDKASIIFDSAPVGFDEVRAITLGDGAGGSVRTVMPVPDFTSSVVEATVLDTAPSWYVTYAADGQSCHGFGADATARAALQAAWEAAPRTYPFSAAALGACNNLGRFSIAGDLTDYVMAKSIGETDLLSGRNDGAGVLSMRAPKRRDASTRLAKGKAIERQGEPVWVAGVGVAIPLGNNMFLAARENDKSGFRLVALKDMVKITTAQALRRAESDCSLKGLNSACGLLAGIERERLGLRTVGYIPLLSSPISITLSKEGTNLSGTVTLNLNIDLKPKASFDYSISDASVTADVGADYTIAPELGLTASYGKSIEGYTVPGSSKKKKFNGSKAKATADKNKKDLKKTVLSIDVGRLSPQVGAVLDLSVNLVIGLEIGGGVSVKVTPKLTMAGDFGVHAHYEHHWIGDNDEDIAPYFHMPTKQPSVAGEIKGEAVIEPYVELNFAAGIRRVAPQVARIYARGGIEFKGEVSTGFSYATKFAEKQTPATYAEGKVTSKSKKYYEFCDMEARVKNPSCACKDDIVKVINAGFVKIPVVITKCVQRGDPVLIPAKKVQVPQVCVNEPELALGVYTHAKAGIAVSSDKIIWPLNNWLRFINRDVTLIEKEWPIWEYPPKDDDDGTDLTGCHDIE